MVSGKIPIMAEAFCAPHRSDHFKKYNTCLTKDELIAVVRDWNASHSSASLRIDGFESMSIPQLKKALEDRHKEDTGCDDEVCWVKESPTLANKTKDIFRPLRSNKWRSGRTWLNTLDIMHVMRQYEQVHPHFMFLGVFPVDFDLKIENSCVVRSMCDFHVKQVKDAKKTMFSMVINLDTHDQPGSHWVTLFCCIDPTDPKYGACYFDSGGVRPEPVSATGKNHIEDFLRRVKAEVVELHGPDHATKFWVRYSPERKQYKNTECGMFCLLFNILCLEKRVTYKEIRTMIGHDDDVQQLRKILYANADKAQKKKTKALKDKSRV